MFSFDSFIFHGDTKNGGYFRQTDIQQALNAARSVPLAVDPGSGRSAGRNSGMGDGPSTLNNNRLWMQIFGWEKFLFVC